MISYLSNISNFPQMGKVQQEIDAPHISDIRGKLLDELSSLDLDERIDSGEKVGITVGSRGIANLSIFVKSIAEKIREAQGVPFVIPSMGSHGGGTSKGQLELLESLGIKELGVPIKANSEVCEIGQTENSLPVFVNKVAVEEADKIILFNRIKPHTEFDGSIESGLVKICAIGLGNPKGARTVHKMSLDYGYEKTIKDVGSFIIKELPILGGVATVENHYYETFKIKALYPNNILQKEKNLLLEAKKHTGKLPFENIDVLIVEEIGKNISGSGLDTNVIGRRMVYGQEEPNTPNIKRIVVLDITEASHGNATGIGLADFTVNKVIEKIEEMPSYLNCITAQTPEKIRIPPSFNSDKEAIAVALNTIGFTDPQRARLVRIKNTELLEEIEVSQVLWEEAKEKDELTRQGSLTDLTFKEDGRICKL